MRKVGAVALGVPVFARVYLAVLLGSRAGRVATGIASLSIAGLLLAVSLPPAPSTATQASGKPAPVAAELLDAVRTGHALGDPFTIRFDAPMDAASVAAALRIQPQDAVTLAWDAAGRVLTVSPVAHWQADTLYAITVDASAHTASGMRLSAPVRAVILTRGPGTGGLAASDRAGTRVRLDTTFTVALDRPATAGAVQAALHTQPVLQGSVSAGAAPNTYVFTPSAALKPDTRYKVWLAGLRDAEGIAFAATPALTVRTILAPTLVRFRPHAKTHDVARSAVLSVRFTQAMDRATTAKALRVLDGKTAIAGTLSWAEKDTVLVFRPKALLPFGAAVTMSVGSDATSKTGAQLANPTSATFGVVAKPQPKKAPPKPASKPAVKISHSGGSGAASGSWTSVERYYLRLMNCTRQGGWVTSSGSCSSPGGRNVAALALSAGISSHVSRPYAKLLATHGECDHFIGGTPGDRLRRAGYRSYKWAENLGCRSGNPYSAVLGSHLYFQSEKPYSGGHYVNLMNALYDRVGIGVWVSSGRVRLVVDFYHP